MPIFYHTAEKQCFQSLQCGAVHSRILSKTQGRAGGRLQHPKWYFQRFRALNTIRSTMCHGSGPSDYFAVYPYRPAKPRVPWIMHLALFSIMGFVLTTCITGLARTSHWRRTRRNHAAYSSPMLAASSPLLKWAGCITDTNVGRPEHRFRQLDESSDVIEYILMALVHLLRC